MNVCVACHYRKLENKDTPADVVALSLLALMVGKYMGTSDILFDQLCSTHKALIEPSIKLFGGMKK